MGNKVMVVGTYHDRQVYTGKNRYGEPIPSTSYDLVSHGIESDLKYFLISLATCAYSEAVFIYFTIMIRIALE